MLNKDLIAYLQPFANQFDPNQFLDATATIHDIEASPERLTIRFNLPAGLYRCELETVSGAFDMSTAMVEMVRAPDGKRVPVGPWDLDHIHNVMAIPMARTYVNGKLKGGLWFDMPGPQQIADRRLRADFGFEVQEGQTELVLEFIERDRQRMDWRRMRYLAFYKDDRQLFPLHPQNRARPRVFVGEAELEGLRQRWLEDPWFKEAVRNLHAPGACSFTGAQGGEGGDLDLACLVYLLNHDEQIGRRIRQAVLEIVRLPTWSNRPDPLLIGGDNDRLIGSRLYYTGIAWDYLGDLFSESERRQILDRVGEYLQKLYDFTLLQRAYMGCPTPDEHSTGTWNGVAVACMAFYDDLEIARHALPFFHGLFVDSLTLFPKDGKTKWATFFGFHLVRYLAAAHTFGGMRPELGQSPYLDHLGRALLACFQTPNAQELQRGLRTIEHRHICAFLSRFHPTEGIDAIYQAFVEQERKTAGNVHAGFFDLLYAPAAGVAPAAFPNRPLYAKDAASVIAIFRGDKPVGLSLTTGLGSGARAAFSIPPHTRDSAPHLACFELSVDASPVLVNVFGYGRNSALTNAMCFEDGGALVNGQYLNGDMGAEKNPIIRRCHIGERFVYVHAIITPALHPRLRIEQAERIVIFDTQTGATIVCDSFAADSALRFGTHLHCSGSITDLGQWRYRLTGGQANLIAGIKGGAKGLSDEEKGEIFLSVLNHGRGDRVVLEEPAWVPTYIYGVNLSGVGEGNDLSQARFPRYRRWRLQRDEPVRQGAFVYALTPRAGEATWADGSIALPSAGRLYPGGAGPIHAMGVECVAEYVLVDEARRSITCLGVRSFKHDGKTLAFSTPVDLEYALNGHAPAKLFSPSRRPVLRAEGFAVGDWAAVGEESWKTSGVWKATLDRNT